MSIISKIPMFHNDDASIKLTSGWSEDEKWKVTTSNQESYVVRFSDIRYFDQKKMEFDSMKRVCQYTSYVPEVITVGKIDEDYVCYIVYRFVEGVLLQDIIHSFSEEQQYDLGIQAGKILRAIHQEKGSYTIDPYIQIKNKLQKKKEIYAKSGLVEEHHDLIVDYLDRHLELLQSQTSSFCHGDFHIGNMLYGPDQKLYVIDFNRSNIEDSFHDFNRMLSFGVRYSKHFVNGQIKGYFGNQSIPKTFFPIALFYVCMDIGFGLLWAMQFGDEEIKVHQELVSQILNDFSMLQSYLPKWWKE